MNVDQIDKFRTLQDKLIDRSCTEYNLQTSLLLMEGAEAIGNLLASRREWIRVEDRLPDLEPNVIKYGSMGYKQKSIRVLCACKQKSGKNMVKEGYYEVWVDNPVNPHWRIPGTIDSVTHWMPLPSPPTEKENKDGMFER